MKLYWDPWALHAQKRLRHRRAPAAVQSASHQHAVWGLVFFGGGGVLGPPFMETPISPRPSLARVCFFLLVAVLVLSPALPLLRLSIHYSCCVSSICCSVRSTGASQLKLACLRHCIRLSTASLGIAGTELLQQRLQSQELLGAQSSSV